MSSKDSEQCAKNTHVTLHGYVKGKFDLQFKRSHPRWGENRLLEEIFGKGGLAASGPAGRSATGGL